VVCRERQIPIELALRRLVPREGEGLILEIRMGCFDHASNTIDLVTATKYTAFGVIENGVFVKDLVDCSATAHGVILAKYIAQITKQQDRYAVGHRILRSDRGLHSIRTMIKGWMEERQEARRTRAFWIHSLNEIEI
jgi:hypothetical protein